MVKTALLEYKLHKLNWLLNRKNLCVKQETYF